MRLSFSQDYQTVKSGAILYPSDQDVYEDRKNKDTRSKNLELNKQLTFYMFKVVIGRALVMQEHDFIQQIENTKNPREIMDKEPNYESIYLKEGDNRQDVMSSKYIVFDKEKVRLMYKVQTTIKIGKIYDNTQS